MKSPKNSPESTEYLTTQSHNDKLSDDLDISQSLWPYRKYINKKEYKLLYDFYRYTSHSPGDGIYVLIAKHLKTSRQNIQRRMRRIFDKIQRGTQDDQKEKRQEAI